MTEREIINICNMLYITYYRYIQAIDIKYCWYDKVYALVDYNE